MGWVICRPKVHLDTDYLVTSDDFVGLGPMSVLCARLTSLINPGIDSLDSPDAAGGSAVAWSAETARIVGAYFREFVSELLQVRHAYIE